MLDSRCPAAWYRLLTNSTQLPPDSVLPKRSAALFDRWLAALRHLRHLGLFNDTKGDATMLFHQLLEHAISDGFADHVTHSLTVTAEDFDRLLGEGHELSVASLIDCDRVTTWDRFYANSTSRRTQPDVLAFSLQRSREGSTTKNQARCMQH